MTNAPMMVPRVPFVHAADELLRDGNGEVGARSQHVQVGVGDHRCDFNDGLPVYVKPGHFEVDPNHTVVAFVHAPHGEDEGLDSSFGFQRRQAPSLGVSNVKTI